MSEDNKAVARKALEAFSTGDLTLADEAIAPDAEDHDPQNPFRDERGPEGAKKVISTYREAFPDLRFDVEEQVAEGDMVCTRWTAYGTNDGELMGMPATGKSVTVAGLTMDRFDGGQIAESWTVWDALGMMQSLGMVPEPEGAAAGS